MSLDSNAQVSPDVEEQKELSTSSDTNTGSEATEEEIVQPLEETAEEQPTEVAEPSTEEKPTKPRKPRQKSQMREMEDRILDAVDQRLSQATATSSEETTGASPAQAATDPNVQTFLRKVNSFNDDLESYRRSSDPEEQAIARTTDDMLAGRNALSDIDLSVKQQLVIDGITPDELHDLNEHYGDKLVPQTPDVEYRTIKRYLRQLRSGNAPSSNQTPQRTVRKPHKPVSAIAGGGGGAKRATSLEALDAHYRGKT